MNHNNTNDDSKKIKVAQKSFNGLHFLTISCYIEERIFGKETYFGDTIFIEMTPNYVAVEKEVMLLNTMDLRSMSYAIKEIFKKGESKYKKYTDPQKTGVNKAKKELSFGKKEDSYYLNMASGKKTIAFSFDAYGFASFADVLRLLAEETEKALYSHQRDRS